MPIEKSRLRASTRTRWLQAWHRRALLAGLTGLMVVLGSLLGPLTPAAAAEGWDWPLEPPEVVHEFDPPDNPYGSGHRGVDLAGSVGQAVSAPSSGVVTFAGVIAGRGVVVVSHGAVRSTLEPVVAEVVVGMPVGAGERVGTLQGFAHHCDSPCLHWGVLRGDTYLDPLDFVGAGPSRLLPWWDDAALANALTPRAPGVGSNGSTTGKPSTTDRAVPQAETAWITEQADDGEPAGVDASATTGVSTRGSSTHDAETATDLLSLTRHRKPGSADVEGTGDGGPKAGDGTGMVAAAVISMAGGALAGGLVLRALRSRR